MALYLDSLIYLHGINAYLSARTALLLKSSIFWVIMTCHTPKIIRRFGGTCRKAPLAACFVVVSCLTHSLNPKDGGDMFYETSVNFQRTTRRYIPEEQTPQNCRCENYKWGSGGIDPCFLDLGTKWRWVVSFTPRPLYPLGKSLRYPSQRRLGGTQTSHSLQKFWYYEKKHERKIFIVTVVHKLRIKLNKVQRKLSIRGCKRVPITFALSACNFLNRLTNLHGISYSRLLLKTIDTLNSQLKSGDSNNGHCTWRPTCVSVGISIVNSLNICRGEKFLK
jgi:hypothetical protein